MADFDELAKARKAQYLVLRWNGGYDGWSMEPCASEDKVADALFRVNGFNGDQCVVVKVVKHRVVLDENGQ